MNNPFLKIFASLLSLFILISCEPEKSKEVAKVQTTAPLEKLVPMLNYSVVKKYGHDITCFTEGFLLYDNKLYESTGSPNLSQTKSTIGISNLETGNFEQKVEIDRNQYFGEGIVVYNHILYQLTYTNQIGFTYDAKTFAKKSQFSYANKEGWGITSDGTHLIMSDGTNNLTYFSPGDFKPIKVLAVSENGFALDRLNELEYIKGYIYANVWMTNFIVKINPSDGKVIGKLDLTLLYNESKQKNVNLSETNGIAYDSISDKILVTGKLWPNIYEISFPH